MKHEPFRDYEVNVRDRDRARDCAHGLIVFAILAVVMSFNGCTSDPSYSPETQNARTLEEIACGTPPTFVSETWTFPCVEGQRHANMVLLIECSGELDFAHLNLRWPSPSTCAGNNCAITDFAMPPDLIEELSPGTWRFTWDITAAEILPPCHNGPTYHNFLAVYVMDCGEPISVALYEQNPSCHELYLNVGPCNPNPPPPPQEEYVTTDGERFRDPYHAYIHALATAGDPIVQMVEHSPFCARFNGAPWCTCGVAWSDTASAPTPPAPIMWDGYMGYGMSWPPFGGND